MPLLIALGAITMLIALIGNAWARRQDGSLSPRTEQRGPRALARARAAGAGMPAGLRLLLWILLWALYVPATAYVTFMLLLGLSCLSSDFCNAPRATFWAVGLPVEVMLVALGLWGLWRWIRAE